MKIVIIVEGPRGCGKTWTIRLIEAMLRQHFRTVQWLEVNSITQAVNGPPIESIKMEVKL